MTDMAHVLREVQFRQEIEALNRVFARALDGGTLEDYLSIFTKDVYYRSGPRVLEGHAGLTDFFVTREKAGRVSRHMMGALDLERQDEDHATGHSVWLTFAGAGALPIQNCDPFQVADIKDQYVRTEAGWRISRREISTVFRNPGIAPPVKDTGK